MSREILDSVWSASGIRLIGDGVTAGDVMAAQASLTHWDEWFPYWTRLGDTYERLAREALARNRRQSAGELFWQAFLSHHYAQFLWFHDPVRRDQGQMRKVALYREAAPLFAAPAIRFDVPPRLSAAAARGVRPRASGDRGRIGEHQGAELPLREPVSRA